MAKKQRMIVSMLLACGIGMLILAATNGGNSGQDITVTQNPAIDALIPARESEILRGDRFGIDLAEGYKAALQIETSDRRTIAIPSDQLDPNFQNNLGVFSFRPGEGQVLEVLPPQSNCVTATYWPLTDPSDAKTIFWCFQVT